MTLDPRDIDRLAHRVVELLEQRGLVAPAEPRLLDAREAARRLGRSRDWVYAHAGELGAVHLGEMGEGRRPRLGFPLEHLEAYVSSRSGGVGSNDREPAPDRAPWRRRRASRKPDVQLLPISDREGLG